MPAEKKKERRRQLLVDKQFQLAVVQRLVGWVFSYLVFFLTVAILLPVLLNMLSFDVAWAGWVKSSSVYRAKVLIPLLGVPMMFTAVGVLVHGVRETFKVAGPKMRYEQVFSALSNRKVPQGVRTRSTDHLLDTTAALDQALKDLHHAIGTIQGQGQAIAQRLQRVETPTAADWQNLKQSYEALNSELQSFQLMTAIPGSRPMQVVMPDVEEDTVQGDVVEPMATEVSEPVPVEAHS